MRKRKILEARKFSIQIEKSGASKSFDDGYFDLLSKNLTSIVLKGIGLPRNRKD